MSKFVRLALIIVFIIFVAGITWAIIAAHHNKKDATTKTANTPTLVGTPATTGTPTVATPAPAANPVAKRVKPRTRTVFVEETTEVSASAWAYASAGDGSAWAEAYAE